MNKANFKIKPTIIGENIVLRPFENEDMDHLINILNEAEIKKLTGSVINDTESKRKMNKDEIDKVKEWYRTRNEQVDRLDCAIALKENNQIIGELVFNEYDELTENVNVRIFISRDYTKKGYGTESLHLFIKYGFEVLKFHKISLEVFSFNPHAEKLYLNLGFVCEGIKRDDFKFNNEYIDTKIMSLLISEYKAKYGSI